LQFAIEAGGKVCTQTLVKTALAGESPFPELGEVIDHYRR
jgi:hypothetical protein